MRKTLIAMIIVVNVGLPGRSAHAQDGLLLDYVGSTRDASAILDVRSTNQGVLVPRVDIAVLGTAAPVTTPATGLLVWNTNATTGVGYHYWTGVAWVRLMTSNNTPSGSGTLNYVPKWTPNGLSLANSQIFDNGTSVGVGTASPAQKLHVNGGDIQLNDVVNVAGYRLKSYATGSSMWLLSGNTTDSKLVLSTSAHDWDRQVSFAYVPGTTGDAAGVFTLGQMEKNNASWTHGITRFLTNGTERMRIASNGNVGIGTIAPTSNLVQIHGASGIRISDPANVYRANLVFGNPANGWNSGIRVYDNGDAEMRIWHSNAAGQIVLATGYNGDQSAVMPTDGVFIDQNKVGIGYASPAAATGKLLVNGNVGIGTTTPNSMLTVRTATATANARTASLGNAIGDGNFELAVSRGSTVNASGETTTHIGQAYNGGTITEGIRFFRGGGATDGAMAFVTNNGTERVRILSNGSVGIGTTGPQSLLHVRGGKVFVNQLANNTQTANYAAADLVIGDNTTTRNGYGGTNGSHIFLQSVDKSTITALDESNNLGQIAYQNLRWTIGENIGWGAQSIRLPVLGAGYVKSDASGVLSSGAIAAGDLPSHTHPWNQVTAKPSPWLDAANLIEDNHNFNNSKPSGFYQSSVAANAPGSNWYNMINVRHSNTSNDHGFQIAASYYNEKIWTRTYQGGTGANNGTYTPWAELLSSRSTSNSNWTISSDMAFSPDDISGHSTLSGDDSYVNVNMPFSIRINDVDHSAITISTNGWVAFGTLSSSIITTGCLPNSSFSVPLLAWYMRDLVTIGTNIRYLTVGSAPNRTFIVDFEAYAYGAGSGDRVRGQVQIHETSSMISVKYRDTHNTMNGQNGVIGFQMAGGASAKAFPITCLGKVMDDNRPSEGWSVSPLR
jgi:hypothetical protein